MQQRGIVGSDDRSRVSEVKPEDASRIAGAVHQAIWRLARDRPHRSDGGFTLVWYELNAFRETQVELVAGVSRVEAQVEILEEDVTALRVELRESVADLRREMRDLRGEIRELGDLIRAREPSGDGAQ